jgi:beta-lactamase regulating signal transducer with metallopeptidase domain
VFETIAQALWQQTLLLGLATAATMPLRALTLRFLGAHSAYLLWLGVPAACVGGWLPGPALWTGSAPLPGANLWAPLTPAAWGEAAAGSHNDITSPWLLTLLVVWLAGAALLAWRIVWQHRRMLGLLSPATAASVQCGPLALASARVAPAGSGPVLIGLWWPQLCLPADFQTRFDTAEQTAIVQHEELHRRRHDNAWNLLGTGLLVLHWFNPLAWLALRRMRADQELSCDAAVMQQKQPPSAVVYTRALLKSQGLQAGLSPSGLMRCTDTGSAWLSVHPLVERVSMLKQHHAFAARRRTAMGLVTTAVLLFAGLGHAVQSAPPTAPQTAPLTAPQTTSQSTVAANLNTAQATPSPTPVQAGEINTVMVTMSLEVDGKTVAKPRLFGAMGAPMRVRWKADDAPASTTWEIEITTTAANAPGQLMFSGKLSTGEPLRVVSQPRLITGEGQSASVQMGADAGRPALKLTLKGQRMAQPERAALPTSTLR